MNWLYAGSRCNRFRHDRLDPSQYWRIRAYATGAIGLSGVPGIAASLVIALEASMISPENQQGARKVFMPHIGRLWEASG